jgi:hypothetical protein
VQGPKRDPYLWLHLVGLAALPLCAELCLLGLAAGDPLLPGGWDWLLVGLLGTAPIAAMQWLRPFYPFSIALVSLRADCLDETQQRILQRWSSWEPKAIALVSTVLVLWGLQWLDRLSPVAAEIAPLDNRSLGLLVVWLGALLANGLLAIAAAALWVLLTPTAAFEAIEPFPLGNVPTAFLRPSIRLTRLLTPLAAPEDSAPPKPPEAADAAAPDPDKALDDAAMAVDGTADFAKTTDETTDPIDLTQADEPASAAPVTDAEPIAQPTADPEGTTAGDSEPAPAEIPAIPEASDSATVVASEPDEAIAPANEQAEAAIADSTGDPSDLGAPEISADHTSDQDGGDSSDEGGSDADHGD